MATPLTGWRAQDDAQAYLHDVLMEQPGQKRKRSSIDDTAAVYVSSAPASAVSVDRIMMQAQWVSTYTIQSGLECLLACSLCATVRDRRDMDQHLIAGLWPHKKDYTVGVELSGPHNRRLLPCPVRQYDMSALRHHSRRMQLTCLFRATGNSVETYRQTPFLRIPSA